MPFADHKRPRAVILGCRGPRLTDWERAFFQAVDPLGFILFARNCQTPEQVRHLIGDLRAAVGRPAAPVLVDQEGGRVRRLKPPHWRDVPPAARYAECHARDPELGRELTELAARLMADDMQALGITVDCAPVLDVPAPDGHDIIGDRAYGATPEAVIDLGQAVCRGLLAGGVLPVIKHLPGHGRARADSHLELPRVSAPAEDLMAVDLPPFAALAATDLAPWAMTAHVLYDAWDPRRPATTSPAVVGEVIRGRIGFDGVLVSDDLSMKALDGDLGGRARDALAAGCDLALHCNGDRGEMEAVVAAVGPLGDEAARRVIAAEARRTSAITPLDRAAAEARLAEFGL